MRKSEINRNTAETKIVLSLILDGTGKSDIKTGCGFLDHMLTLFASHGRFDLSVSCKGDVEVDYHHSVEDIGICLGKAFSEAIGDCKGIKRYGNMMLPMDESLVLCALDVSGRSYLAYSLDIKTEKIGDFDTELIEEFFLAFVRNANITLHIKQLDGRNAHHIAEAAFKAFARALRQAVEIDEKTQNEIPSTKGVL
ncbi:MAG: imidazoleglycerol-phosphate dehydratase HisB [Ruminococcaceae bacterium]|nr:imidazoleglycerol-phosphate dehydratase HisB [Oscillospiraceae bacterium]